MALLLGIDNGLTVTKAVIFDERGNELAAALRRVPQSMPRPRHVERDMEGLWQATAEAIAEAVARCGRPAAEIAAVAATAHGDGLYLLDEDCKPLGPGILSLDSRAGEVADRWSKDGTAQAALRLTGQVPHASAPSALLTWIKENEPERFSRIGHVLACKDWLRFCLTGTVGTDRTEASTAFTELRSQRWSREAMELYGLRDKFDALPVISHSAGIVGEVTREAAALTGLAPGTPVAAGLHDVTASALGIGAHREGVAAVVAGTYSINEAVSSTPRTDARWFCRAGIAPGTWNNMSISPASAANYDWFLDTLCASDKAAAERVGGSIHGQLAEEIGQALARPSTVLFHPYLFGSPHDGPASASFVGLNGWHKRGDMLAAVLEGIAFNHRHHVDALADGFAFDRVGLTGGASRNPAFAQMMADILGLPVTVTNTNEAAAWGAAICAGAAVGLFPAFDADPRDISTEGRIYQPNDKRHAMFDRRYAVYSEITEAMKPYWRSLEALGEAGDQ